jgi:hypothetical protein
VILAIVASSLLTQFLQMGGTPTPF